MSHGLRYGLLGLPLAFLALPLYVSLPAYYAREHGLALASLGALLLAARAADALLDPLIGRLSDGWLRPGRVGSGVMQRGGAGQGKPEDGRAETSAGRATEWTRPA